MLAPFANEPYVPSAYRALGKALSAVGKSPVQLAEELAVDDDARFDLFRYFSFAEAFVESGAPTYVLSHSAAAALTATRQPSLSLSYCPYPAFFVETPSEFLPLRGRSLRPKRWISILVHPPMAAIAVHEQGIRSFINLKMIDDRLMDFDWLFRDNSIEQSATPRAKDLAFEMNLAVRIALNTIAFVTTYRESVKRREGTPSNTRLLDVACPRDVMVDRAFRDQVIALVSARTIPRARGVLAHLVRGHWKRVGSDKDLRWIAPYRRGDANIGSVVARTEQIELLNNGGGT